MKNNLRCAKISQKRKESVKNQENSDNVSIFSKENLQKMKKMSNFADDK